MVGARVGLVVGAGVGLVVGAGVGLVVGAGVGLVVGEGVGLGMAVVVGLVPVGPVDLVPDAGRYQAILEIYIYHTNEWLLQWAVPSATVREGGFYKQLPPTIKQP